MAADDRGMGDGPEDEKAVVKYDPITLEPVDDPILAALKRIESRIDNIREGFTGINDKALTINENLDDIIVRLRRMNQKLREQK